MSFDFRAWLTQGISELPEKELRKLYSQTLHAVRRRQQRMARSRLAGTAQGQQAARFETFDLRDLGSRDLIEKELMNLQDFMGTKTTSVRGLYEIRRNTLEELHTNHYTFVNAGNLDKFGAFMEEWRKQHPSKKEGSPTPAELRPIMRMMKELTPEEIKAQFDDFEKNLDPNAARKPRKK